MDIIAVCNQKGGCGKTVTAVSLAGALSGFNKRTLLLDLDPQAHATSAFGIKLIDAQKSSLAIFEAFIKGEQDLYLTTLMQHRYNNLWVMGSHISLNTMEQKLAGLKNAVLALSNTIRAKWEQEFDYIIIDTPPNLGFLTLNAMHAAARIIVPVDISLFSLNGVSQISELLDLSSSMGFAKPKVNFLICAYDKRSNFAKDFLQSARERFGSQLFQNVIRSNIKLREACQAGKVIFEHDISANGAKDYIALATEVVPGLKDTDFNAKDFVVKPSVTKAIFKLYAPQARSVYLAASFNGWSIDDKSLMKRLDNGTWFKIASLPEGVYKYKFVVDGKWLEDPANTLKDKDGLGGINSLISVKINS